MTKLWVFVTQAYPTPYELVIVLTACGKEILAWHNGQAWDGYRLRPHHIVVKWKRSYREDRFGRELK